MEHSREGGQGAPGLVLPGRPMYHQAPLRKQAEPASAVCIGLTLQTQPAWPGPERRGSPGKHGPFLPAAGADSAGSAPPCHPP